MCLIGLPEGRRVGPELGPPDAPADGLFWPPDAFGLLPPKNGLTSHTIRASTTTRNAAKPRRKRWRRRRATEPRLEGGRKSGLEDRTTDQYPTRLWLRHAWRPRKSHCSGPIGPTIRSPPKVVRPMPGRRKPPLRTAVTSTCRTSVTGCPPRDV